jgi:dihydroneopterin aldolase
VTDVIEVRGIRALGRHGVLAEEQERAQPFEIDVRLEVDASVAAASDDLSDTVDYGALALAVAGIVESESHNLLERLAVRLAETCRSDPGVSAVEVTVRKLRPPIAAMVESVAVTVRR